MVDASGGSVSVVGEGEGPAWSRDGRLTFFGRDGIMVARSDGSGARLALHRTMGAFYRDFAWFPNGRGLIFSRTVYDNRSELFTMREDGTSLRPPTHQRHAVDPSWSPNGRLLAFTRVFAAGNREIALVRAEGSHLRTVTRNQYAWDWQPTWSPDGTRIAFVRFTLWGVGTLYVLRIDERRAHPLGALDRPYHPAWSPDGRRIAVDGLRNSQTPGIRLVDAQTGAVEEVTHPAYGYDRAAAWSPDGRRLVFVRRYSGGSIGSQEVWVVTLGGDAQQIADDYGPDPLHADFVRWSPEGTRIAAAGWLGSDFGGPPAVVTMRPDGTHRQVIWKKGRYLTGLSWAPR